MNSNDRDNSGFNTNSVSHKKRGHAPSFDEFEMLASGLPRKRFISEESVARDMAAMSLSPFESSQIPSQKQHMYCYPYFGQGAYLQPPPEKIKNSNIVRIDDINQFLSDEEEEQTDIDPLMIRRDANGITLVESLDGLPLELRSGESKPRIPDFVLANPELMDPRDISACQSILKSLAKGSRCTRIEVLNDPTVHYGSSSMDID